MAWGQMPDGAIVPIQMPYRSLVGYVSSGTVEPPIEPEAPPKEDDTGSSFGFADDMYEYEEFEDGKPIWKERSYRELKETIEILTMVGFFE